MTGDPGKPRRRTGAPPVEDRSTCLLCGRPLSRHPLAVLRRAPEGAQRLAEGTRLSNDRPRVLTIKECPDCGLVQHTGRPVAGHRAVITAAGLSPEMAQYRSGQLGDWVRTNRLQGRSILVVGCGRGELLPLLERSGAVPTGLEAGGAAQAAGSAPGAILRSYPTDRLRVPGRPFAGFVCINVLEHAPDPRAFLRGVAANLEPDAVGLIEVPSLQSMVDEGRAYDWVADHLSYFTERTLRLALELSGFEVLEASPAWKGYDVAAHVRRRPPSTAADLDDDLRHATRALGRWLTTQAKAGRRVCVWGASHQALTLLAEARADGSVQYIVDSAAFKQGRYAPVTHIPIVAPEALRADPVDAVLVMAAGYSDEVVGQLRSVHAFTGEILVLRGRDLLPA